jgi:hypothetical protein
MKVVRMTWVGHVVCMEKRRGACKVLVEKPEARRPLRSRRHSIHGTIILEWILNK